MTVSKLTPAALCVHDVATSGTISLAARRHVCAATGRLWSRPRLSTANFTSVFSCKITMLASHCLFSNVIALLRPINLPALAVVKTPQAIRGASTGERDMTSAKTSWRVTPKIPEDLARRDRRDGSSARDRPANGADFDALAEHMAVEGHLPRIRARLRQEGQRHDRRRPEDRGASGRRGRARLRTARSRLEGDAGRRPWRARLPLRQADGAGAVGLGPCLCDGRQHAAGLAQIWRRQRASGQALRLESAPMCSPSPMGRCRRSRSAGSRSR